MERDTSNGYEAVATEFMRVRSDAGLALIRDWAASLPDGASVLELGAGSGEPLTRALVEAGLDVHAIDASPAMVAAFRERFPTLAVACESVEDSAFFHRRFDAVLAVGLLFLLGEHAQRDLIARVARALHPCGRFLFSAPHQTCEWEDVLTGQTSRSLGRGSYLRVFADAGLTLHAEHTDESGNHYFEAIKAATPRSP